MNAAGKEIGGFDRPLGRIPIPNSVDCGFAALCRLGLKVFPFAREICSLSAADPVVEHPIVRLLAARHDAV
jgi:hypothetical protein